MDKIIQGIRHFQDEVFPKNRALFQNLASSQSPETLVIACSDSRISLDLITQTSPGDLFVCRNAGNLVPPHGKSNAVSASIEYALNALPIRDIVICGHSDCGAMKGLLHPKALRRMPQVKGWLTHAEGALAAFERQSGAAGAPDAVARLAKYNVRLQLEHLRTFPSVFSRVQEGTLRLHGWFYQIDQGEVSQCQGDGSWIPLRHPVPYEAPLVLSASSAEALSA
ncbi:MAG: carbonic anhydrase [Candidatus Solibacter sp.]